MSRKADVTQHITISRLPTVAEASRMRQRFNAGGKLHPSDASVVMLDRVLDSTQPGGFHAMGHGLAHSKGRAALIRGVTHQAIDEDPIAHLLPNETRDYVSKLNMDRQLGLPSEQVNNIAEALIEAGEKRNEERARQAQIQHYIPGKDAPDVRWNRDRSKFEPRFWREVLSGMKAFNGQSDMKGGRTVRTATGGGQPGDFADAVQGASTAEAVSASERLRSTLSTREGEKAAYKAIQKSFFEKNGRLMDEDTAWLRAGMQTGLLNKASALRWGREIRQERDTALANRLAAEAVNGMPRDAQGFIVPRDTDPFVKYDTWDLRRSAVQSMLNANAGSSDEFTPAQKLFLAHKYGLAPQVSFHTSYRQDPMTGSGPQGTFDKNAAKSFRMVPSGHVVDVDTGRVYPETDTRVIRSRNAIARAQRGEWLSLVDRALHDGFGHDSVKTQVFVSPEEYNDRINGGPVTWNERTGRYTPVENEFADPEWHHVRAEGVVYPGDQSLLRRPSSKSQAQSRKNILAGMAPFAPLPTAMRAPKSSWSFSDPLSFVRHQLPGTRRSQLKREKVHGK